MQVSYCTVPQELMRNSSRLNMVQNQADGIVFSFFKENNIYF